MAHSGFTVLTCYLSIFWRQYFDYVSKVLLPETLVMLYMKVVGKTQDEVCGNFLACSVGFFLSRVGPSPPYVVVSCWDSGS